KKPLGRDVHVNDLWLRSSSFVRIVWLIFRLLNHNKTANMESMDISYGEAAAGNESTMIYDEEMHECSERNIHVKEFAPNDTTVQQDSNNTVYISSEITGSSNATVLLNNSFPNHSEDEHSTDSSIRFPLQDSKESNQSNIVPCSVNMAERLKFNLLNNSTPFEVPTPDKENMFAEESGQARINVFPTEAKHSSDAFPLDHPGVSSDRSSVSTFADEEEQFIPANEYNFSAADFDCLLSRGCPEPTISTSKSSTASSATPSVVNLPRNSVLINFDPLLRRQTILKPEVPRAAEGVEGDPFPCLALADFAQQQNRECAASQPTFYDTIQNTSELRNTEVSVLLLENLTPSALPLETRFVTNHKDGGVQQAKTLCCLLDTSVLVSSDTACSKLNRSSLDKTVIQKDSETADSFKSLNHLLLRTTSLGHDILGEQAEQGESLLVQIGSDVPFAYQEDSQDSTTVSEQYPAEDTTHTSDIEHTQDSVVANIPSSTVTTATVEVSIKPIEDTNSIPYLSSASCANNDLTLQNGEMLAEPQPETHNNTILNMSDDRSTTNEDGYVEVGKKCKNEEVNIADMEKKMHDVELREEGMLKRITEKDKTISKMSNVVEAYERTIAELISEKESLIRNHEAECESLKQDNEINAQHLESLEKTFSNLYAKYERMKKNAIKYKEHEEKLLEKVMKLEECLRAHEQRYEKMKSHAMSQLDIANTKLDEAIRNHSQESAKFKAQIKKEELNRISINEQLIQKSKENEELLKICDELIKSTN
uniref:Transforming acidic coiled-coil-containing protein C-terminal domain-containing protein n=1 Tax=Anopheles dirus TaxID=7168 RepID=A0A182NNM8_9DIPT